MPRFRYLHQSRSPRGAYFMLKVRTAVMNGTFERDHIALGQSTRHPKRPGRLAPPSLRRSHILIEYSGYRGAHDNMKGIGRIYQQTFIDTFVVRRPARLSSPNPPRACRARHVGGGVPDRAEANSAATPLDSKRLANAAGVGARATGRAAVTTFGSSRSHVSLRKTLGDQPHETSPRAPIAL